MDEDQVSLASNPPVLRLFMHDSHSSASLLKISSKPGGTSAPGLVVIRPQILWERRWLMGTSPLLVTATACPTLRGVDMSFTRRSLNYLKETGTTRSLARRSHSFASTSVAREPDSKSSKANHPMGLLRVLIAPPPLRLHYSWLVQFPSPSVHVVGLRSS